MKALGLVIAAVAAFRRYLTTPHTVDNLMAYVWAYRALEDESFSRHIERTRLP